MTVKKARLQTRISADVKIRWEQFILSRHDVIRGEYGPELERAMEMYMTQFESSSILPATSPDKETGVRVNKTTYEALRLIMMAFRNIPSYPLLNPRVIRAVVRDAIPYKDYRTHNKYMKIVLFYVQPHIDADGYSTKESVRAFCEYVDSLDRKWAFGM